MRAKRPAGVIDKLESWLGVDSMQAYQRAFFDLCVAAGVLRFGEFTLKSGRRSPYFFNTGLFNTGKHLARLGSYYARALLDSGIPFDTLYGPAYKGIPLVSATAVALWEHYQQEVPFAFNRKEAKRHGEGGRVIGAQLQGNVVIIDDVISAGTSVRESVEMIHSAGAHPSGVVIALDRQERGQGSESAIVEVEREYGLVTASIVKLSDLIQYLGECHEYQFHLEALCRYREQYGTESG